MRLFFSPQTTNIKRGLKEPLLDPLRKVTEGLKPRFLHPRSPPACGLNQGQHRVVRHRLVIKTLLCQT